MLEKIKCLLPVTRRRHDDQIANLTKQIERITHESEERIIARIVQADGGINGNIDFKYHELAEPRLNRIQETIDTHDSHMKLMEWSLLRRDDEEIDQTKIRFFQSIPKATGKLRVLQNSCIELLAEFDSFCKENNLHYWACCGTLLGAIRHQGFIPWDDDIDLGMMREDIDKLKKALKSCNKLRLTTVYDHYVHSEQLRLRFNNSENPAFLDIFYFDYISTGKQSIYKQHQAIREEMVEIMEADKTLKSWQSTPYIDNSNPMSLTIRKHIDTAIEKEKELGLIVDRPQAKGIIWSLDNLYPNDRYEWAVPLEVMFPLHSSTFETTTCQVPNNPDSLLNGEFGDYLALPADINTHFKHVNLDDVQ